MLNLCNSKSITKTSPPKVINIRSFKKFQVDQFQVDISAAPFHEAHIFDHKDDVLWAWNSLLKEICDFHAPVKHVRIRSQSLPWMDNSSLVPVFKKDDGADASNYRPISLLSAPSKIMESCVSDTIVRHVFDNNLITDYQWAYLEGYSTELLLVNLSETGRKAVD